MRYEVDVIRVPEQALVVLAGHGTQADRRRDLARLAELAAEADLVVAGHPMARLSTIAGPDAAGDYEVCLPVAARPDGSVPDRVGEARGELVPAHAALHAVHEGEHAGLAGAWAAVEEARAALGYSASAPATEVYVHDAGDASVTELRLPYAN